MQRKSLIRYTAASGVEVEAQVKRLHRDGSVTVEPRFFIEGGRKVPGFIGGSARLLAADCQPCK